MTMIHPTKGYYYVLAAAYAASRSMDPIDRRASSRPDGP